MNTPSAKPAQKSEFGLGGLEYYGWKDYRRLFWRRKWGILTFALAFALAVSVGVRFWPDSYTAKTAILVDPGKIPDAYIRSTATIPAAERMALLQTEILSDTRLSQVIDEMGLYSNLKNTKTRDQIVLQMRNDISVDPLSYASLQSVGNTRAGLAAFTISFTSKSPAVSAKVANRLASLFIEENMKAREQQVMGTAEFFDRELEKAKEDLRTKGQKVEQLRSRYYSALPESQSAHLQALSNLQLEMRAEMDSVNRAQQQKVYLQSLLAQSPRVVDLDASSSGGQGDPESAQQEQMARLQGLLDQYRTRYGPDYPDVLKLQVEIQRLQGEIAKAQKAAAAKAASAPAAASTSGHQNPVIESQLGALDQEILKHEQREKELQEQINFHQSKLEGVPGIEQQLAAATRDYDNAEQNYKDVQARKFAADISSDVETRQKGERFVIIEPAQPPLRPSQPNRPLIDELALPAGLVIAFVLVLVLELLDSTIKTEREVTEQVRAAVFAEIPWLPTRQNTSRKLIRSVFALGGNTVLALAYFAVIFVSLR